MREIGVLERPSDALGMHVCWAYSDVQSFRDVAKEHVIAGVAARERVVYVADASENELAEHLAGVDAERLVADGGLLLQPVHALYEPGGIFDAAAQVHAYRALIDDALARGFAGLRVIADATALVSTDEAHRRFVAYELAVDHLMATAPMSAICAYDTAQVGDRVNALAAVHPCWHHSLEVPPLRAHFDEQSLRLSGEVDLSTDVVFEAVIHALMSCDDHLTLDTSGLTFIDVRSLARLGEVACVLAATGRSLRVRNLPPVARRCATLLELDALLEATVEP